VSNITREASRNVVAGTSWGSQDTNAFDQFVSAVRHARDYFGSGGRVRVAMDQDVFDYVNLDAPTGAIEEYSPGFRVMLPDPGPTSEWDEVALVVMENTGRRGRVVITPAGGPDVWFQAL
jgi:hypothetical protein